MGKKRYKPRHPHMEVAVPTKFVPCFWQDEDHRSAAVKEIIRRYELLKEDAGADSYQKELLCQRAVFMSLRLETMEVQAAKTGELDQGLYTMMVNSLVGLLKAIGLEKHAKKAITLKKYVEERTG
jgi:hypothetical protein